MQSIIKNIFRSISLQSIYFLSKSNMLVNHEVFGNYIEANTCPFSCFLAVKTFCFSKMIEIVDKIKLKIKFVAGEKLELKDFTIC